MSNFLSIVSLIFFVVFVILSTVQTRNFETETTNKLEMLETIDTGLSARLNSVELSNIANISQVESGRCEIGSNVQDTVIDYILYAYVQNNLTLYYVEFQEIFITLDPSVVSTSALCPPIYTRMDSLYISRCGVNFPSITPASMINSLFDYGDGALAFRSVDVSKISVNGDPVLTSYSSNLPGPCAPNTYTIVPRTLQSGVSTVDGFQVVINIFFNNAGPIYTANILPGLRVPLRSGFQIGKK